MLLARMFPKAMLSHARAYLTQSLHAQNLPLFHQAQWKAPNWPNTQRDGTRRARSATEAEVLTGRSARRSTDGFDGNAVVSLLALLAPQIERRAGSGHNARSRGAASRPETDYGALKFAAQSSAKKFLWCGHKVSLQVLSSRSRRGFWNLQRGPLPGRVHTAA
ncbi:hypothetical protein F1559_000072 [Cyanidiococcus yangmingshanensis]|uniref:Uncharacterized protein n=1 Tax=Cyanidiococcus yangmingshanensis TaxID=2690220 RepID=A0A7J7IFV2_9RHOD|nr:hypothetical protein F1559_000072 [Cyanidiococcus yangmingshanensis]